jgi:polar amino acid transport system substrate-binding protein
MRLNRTVALVAASLLAAVSLAACAQEETPAAVSPTGTNTDLCADITTVTDGTLTVGTSDPAFPPYVIDNKPQNGKGFESATAYAVAEAMGFSADQVEWTFAPFAKLFAPGDKDYDFALNQISITPARERAVTFSAPYYEAANAVLVLKDSPYADATTMAELQDAKIGVQAATTAQLQVEADIQPTQDLAVYPSSSNASQALKNGQIDAFITDLPTAIYLALPFNVDGTVVGQLPKQEAADTWGLVLQKENPLVSCVDQALGEITADGTLEAITTKWMTDFTKAPVLQ